MKIESNIGTVAGEGFQEVLNERSDRRVGAAGVKTYTQITIFDALANPEPPPPIAIPPPTQPNPNAARIKHQEARIRVYQEFLDTLLQLSRQRWEAAQDDPDALTKYQTWARTVNRDSVQRLIRLQTEARAELERLKNETR